MVSRASPDGSTGGRPAPSLPPLTPRLKLGAVVVLLLLAAGIAVLVSAFGSHGTSQPIESVRSSQAPRAVQSTIYVHLLGEVAAPGLYELPENARAIDAVAAAGGFTADADRAWLNLARFLSDGEQVYVPAVGEQPAGPAVPQGTIGGKVNLNTADAATLETLPRVGPAMAERIIQWRETNGRFGSIDDLKSVTGVGEKTFAALSELITV